MLAFCGQDSTTIDANGRIKFNPRALEDYKNNGGYDVVLHCLPEGAIAIYPEEVYLKMRKSENGPVKKAASSMLFRRTMRRFGSFSKSETISAQGRITIPQAYREYAKIEPGDNVIIIGCEIGLEIWNTKLWKHELTKINDHINDKTIKEMAEDLKLNRDVEG
jgi:DNA-binding transcriptional regulator/RsmH inhibitor MraZ